MRSNETKSLYLSLLSLPSKRASIAKSGLTASRGAQDSLASFARDYGLRMREDGSDSKAASAPDIHKVTVGRLN